MVASSYDWAKEVKELDETKAGVKGLVDGGLTEVPPLFVHPAKDLDSHPRRETAADGDFPTIDFHGVKSSGARRREVVEEIKKAAREWGFFRIVNHGIPLDIMDAMLDGVKRFHEQPAEEKTPFYSYDMKKSVKFNSILPTRENDPACWRDILTCSFRDDQLDPEEIPSACRKEVVEYAKYMVGVREIMSDLLSEALEISSDYLSNIECMKSQVLACLYYPACPEPQKTLGTPKHSDATFLTLLMQDNIGGLQILRDDQWLDVPPLRGAIIANIGDLMQLISNDKFVSVEHRVRAQAAVPRISVASFLVPSMRASSTLFSPIKELLSDENPAIYKEFDFVEYCKTYKAKGDHVASALHHYKI